MNILPINYAEAIIDPFYNNENGGIDLYSHPLMKDCFFKTYNDYTTFSLTWCSLNLSILKGEVNKPLALLKRQGCLDISCYDEFIIFASIPTQVAVTMEVEIDGEIQYPVIEANGLNTTGEIRGTFHGKMLTSYTLTFKLTTKKASEIDIRWIGLASKRRVKELDKIKPVIDKKWPSCIKEEYDRITPQLNLFFDYSELIRIRETIKEDLFKNAFVRLKEQAEKYLSLDPDKADLHIHSTGEIKKRPEDMIPENMISKYVPWGDRRWNSDREMRSLRLDLPMEILAFVGLIEENMEMCRLAVRMALSIAHCEHWTENAMGNLPGVTWHHKSFTEKNYLRACSLVLDWAGFLLTEHGKEIILDALIMKGLPRVESDFKRHEYIRHMNQGIFFTGGRLLAYLSLSKTWPRYKEGIALCKKDLLEMIDNYIENDGGTKEGPAYWNYTFKEAFECLYLLARHEKTNLCELASEKLKKTAEYGANMISVLHHGTMLLPVNDAHWEKSYHLGVVASLYLLSNHPQIKKLYFRMLEERKVENDYFVFVLGHQIKREGEDCQLDEQFSVLKKTGQVDLRRIDNTIGLVHIHYLSGPVYQGHYHSDKGSFILEAGEESFLIDRGVLPYSHPDTSLLRMTENHNCLVPYNKEGDLFNQPVSAIGGKLRKATYEEGVFTLKSEDTDAWEEGLFIKATREIYSDNAREYILTDKGIVSEKVKGMSFRLHTKNKIEKLKDGYIIIGDKCNVKVEPLNYEMTDSGYKKEGIDSESLEVNLLYINSKVTKSYNMKTRLLLIQKD